MEVTKTFTTTGSVQFDAVFVAVGAGSLEALMGVGSARHFVREAFKHCKPVPAREGVQFLEASELSGVRLAEESSGCITEHGVVTSRHTADADDLAQSFVEAIAAHRHWGRDQKDRVAA